MTPKRVLVTCVGSTNAVSIVKALRQQDRFAVHVTGVDCEDGHWTAGVEFCDEFRRVPRVRPGEPYVRALAELVRELGIDLVFPILDEEVVLLGRHRDELPPGVLQLSPQPALELGVDKLAAFELLRANGFGTPRTIEAASFGANGSAELGWPLIAKPRRGFSSRGVHVLASPAELALFARTEGAEEALLQERAEGGERARDRAPDPLRRGRRGAGDRGALEPGQGASPAARLRGRAGRLRRLDSGRPPGRRLGRSPARDPRRRRSRDRRAAARGRPALHRLHPERRDAEERRELGAAEPWP